MKKRHEKGSAVAEFALCCLLLVPLLMGVIGIGMGLIREMEVVQVCRDGGHMYAKGVDFSTSNNAALQNRTMLVSTVGGNLGLTDPAQPPNTPSAGVIYLTTAMLVTEEDCQAAGLSNSQCTNLCTNLQTCHPVITQQIVIGDSTMPSRFGKPNSSNYLTDPGDQITNFPVSIQQHWSTQQAGQIAYLSEVRVVNHTWDWTGYTGSTITAFSIF